MASLNTAIQSHGDVVSDPTETYGSGPLLLRIGNGGAGATGLIQALANDYLSTRPGEGSISWVCNHSRNTQLALLQGYIEVALTYERDQEVLASSEGWSRTVGCVMHDHFCLAGPLDDPAGVMDSSSLSDGLMRVAEHQALFHSRADASATMWKERSLWNSCGFRPWEHLDEDAVSSWYQTSVLSPSEALRGADAAGAYLLTDRSTLLRQVSLGTISRTTVFFEPVAEDDVLMNSCYALCSPTANTDTKLFLDYLVGDRAQDLIKSYGREEAGLPLFAKASDRFARTPLKAGRPDGTKWVSDPAWFVPTQKL